MGNVLKQMIIKSTDAIIAFSIIFFPVIFKLSIALIKGTVSILFSGVFKLLHLVLNRSKKLKINKSLVIPVFILMTIHAPFLYNSLYENNLFKSIDNSAQIYVSEAFVRAGVSYATARTINAVVSMIQESTIDFTPAGVGITVAAGQILDPLNDMVERFSSVILVSIIAIGTMKTMIEIGPFLAIKCILSISMILFMLSYFFQEKTMFYWGRSLLLVAIFVRLAVPGIAYLNNNMYQKFLSEKLQTSTAEISQYNDNLKRSQRELSSIRNEMSSGSDNNEEESSFWSTSKRVFNGELLESAKAQLKMAYEKTKTILTNIKNRTTNVINHFIDLCLVYILSTIVFPISFLWVGIFLLKKVSNIDLQPILDDNIKKQFQPLKNNKKDMNSNRTENQ